VILSRLLALWNPTPSPTYVPEGSLQRQLTRVSPQLIYLVSKGRAHRIFVTDNANKVLSPALAQVANLPNNLS
jgi:hypothetical protein